MFFNLYIFIGFFYFFLSRKMPRGLHTTNQSPRLGKKIHNYRVIYMGWVGILREQHPAHKKTRKGIENSTKGITISQKGDRQKQQ